MKQFMAGHPGHPGDQGSQQEITQVTEQGSNGDAWKGLLGLVPLAVRLDPDRFGPERAERRFVDLADVLVAGPVRLEPLDHQHEALRLPAELFFGQADIWSPRYFELTIMSPERIRGGVGYLTAVARLAPGVSMKSATAEMEVLNQQYKQEFPKFPDSGPDIAMVVGNLQELTVANVYSLFVVLSIAVGLVLMTACANVASLLLSRALGRSKEIAIRSALGARRGAIIRQLLSESMLLALISGVVGL